MKREILRDGQRVQVREFKPHRFKGEIPDVPTYDLIDKELLYQGDSDPFHVTLAVMRVGEVSDNGLLYDAELVERIEEQLAGSGGIRGHLGFFNMDEYPVEEIHWVGHWRRDDGITWAKGYIPPGETREDVRRKKATGGSIGTSIFGWGELEEVADDVYKLRNFELETLDLVPAKRAALKMGAWSGFKITKETEKQEEIMAEQELTMADIPEALREQIVREATINADERVAKLQAELEQRNRCIGEMEQAAAAAQARITELETAGAAQQTRIDELEGAVFERQLIDQIAALTAGWNVTSEAGRKKVAALHDNMRLIVMAELNGCRDLATLRETVSNVWQQRFQVLAEAVIKELAGPPAIVGGSKGMDQGWKPMDPAEARARLGI